MFLRLLIDFSVKKILLLSLRTKWHELRKFQSFFFKMCETLKNFLSSLWYPVAK